MFTRQNLNMLREALEVLGGTPLADRIAVRLDGGSGSGNWGHASVKGRRGGSAPGGGKRNRISTKGGTYTSQAKQRRAQKQAGRKMAASQPEPPSGPPSKWKLTIAEKRAATLAKKVNIQAMEMDRAGVISRQEAIQRMKDGTIGEVVNHYYDVLEANGDPTPTKPTITKQKDMDIDAVVNAQGIDYNEARTMEIMKDTGASREEAEQMRKELETFTDGDMDRADSNVIDEYVRKAPAWQGKMYRGMHLEEPGSYDQFMEQVRSGTIQMRGPSSWTSDLSTCRRFSHLQEHVDSVEIECVANRTATPINHLSPLHSSEDEVLAGSNTRWSVIGVDEYTDKSGNRKAHVRVIERNDEDA